MAHTGTDFILGGDNLLQNFKILTQLGVIRSTSSVRSRTRASSCPFVTWIDVAPAVARSFARRHRAGRKLKSNAMMRKVPMESPSLARSTTNARSNGRRNTSPRAWLTRSPRGQRATRQTTSSNRPRGKAKTTHKAPESTTAHCTARTTSTGRVASRINRRLFLQSAADRSWSAAGGLTGSGFHRGDAVCAIYPPRCSWRAPNSACHMPTAHRTIRQELKRGFHVSRDLPDFDGTSGNLRLRVTWFG